MYVLFGRASAINFDNVGRRLFDAVTNRLYNASFFVLNTQNCRTKRKEHKERHKSSARHTVIPVSEVQAACAANRSYLARFRYSEIYGVLLIYYALVIFSTVARLCINARYAGFSILSLRIILYAFDCVIAFNFAPGRTRDLLTSMSIS
ncbi:hypothetical protein B0H16DRAFT_955442 [Mycena metata]|uniref:Uncharacterized protein n=1 Tax=Mycena metata TaxID=1033252 RepID=A0AAD7K333_9AGAR|nr:hypothetical protein B0H16DRAFT_955442 [Mycena metata]